MRITVVDIGNNLIRIEYRDTKPMRAYITAKKLGDLFISEGERSKIEESQAAYAFIDKQVQEYLEKLTSVEDELSDLGWVIDYADIKSACEPVIEVLDHSYLNEVPGLDNPTSENIAVWLWNEIQPKLAILSEIEVKETCNTGCIYRG